jgi:hypothetical protein
MIKVSLKKMLPESGAARDLVLTQDEKTGRPRKALVYVEAVIRVQAPYECTDIAEQIDEKGMGGCTVGLPSDAQPQRIEAVKEIEAKLASLLSE